MIFEEPLSVEEKRLQTLDQGEKDWQRWGTYLSERQWGTVREDYSDDGDSWRYFPYEMAQYRAYRWGEDGILGWTDHRCRLTLSTCLWNHKDSMLKERLFGLTNGEGNHGEDVKELYYYLDATPTHSYAKGLYRYPQAAFPYEELRAENKRRGIQEREYELLDTKLLDGNRFFDVTIEYAKASPEQLAARITVSNRADTAAKLSVVPTLTFRNTWDWPNLDELGDARPELNASEGLGVKIRHESLGNYVLLAVSEWQPLEYLFTENQTNVERLHGNPSNLDVKTKDAFDHYIVHGKKEAVSLSRRGTRCALLYEHEFAAGEERVLYLYMTPDSKEGPLDPPSVTDLISLFETRIEEADEFYKKCIPQALSQDERLVARQAFAGLLWTKQFYFFAADQWFAEKDREANSTPCRLKRTLDWEHLFCRDVMLVPDKWEYPWFAAWDLAFHSVTMANIDPTFAKEQLLLLMREWYMHANGQMPAYEFGFGDVNPPVQAWAVLRVYESQKRDGEQGDLDFLERAFHKLLANFTWWTNRADPSGKKLFGGGFLGLDNISLFNRSAQLPEGVWLNQADGNAWMGLYAASMLEIAIELAMFRPAYADIAGTFADDYMRLSNAFNTKDGSGLWDEEEGFYFDKVEFSDGRKVFLKVRTMVGLAPLFAVCLLKGNKSSNLHNLNNRVKWLQRASPALQSSIQKVPTDSSDDHFASFIPEDRLKRVLSRMLSEDEFLSPCGIRALSRVYRDHPYEVDIAGHTLSTSYAPAEGTDKLFGGNSNWRGPVWWPVNALLLYSLEQYGQIYGETLQVEFPTGSGRMLTLGAVMSEIKKRMLKPFLKDSSGRRPLHGTEPSYSGTSSLWSELVLFYEYFSGEDGRGVGASHQTGWTSMVADVLCRRK